MRVKKFFTHNLRLKVMALAFSVALWFFVAGQSNTEMGFMVPLGFKGMPKDMVMTASPPGEVEIRVVGPKLIISNLSPTHITAELDLSGAAEGENSYRLTEEDITTPMGVEITRIKPSTFDLRTEKIVSVRVPVAIEVKGRPAAGFRVSGVTLSPDTVVVTGLAGDVDFIEAVEGEPVDISGTEETRLFTTRLRLPDKEFRKLGADSATVRVIIEKETPVK